MTHPHKPPTTVAPATGDCVLLLGALATTLATLLASTPLEGTR
jgi:hypothetical protein